MAAAEQSWTCPMCNGLFLGSMSKANHQKNFYKAATDMTRCDNARLSQRRVIKNPVVRSPLVAVSSNEPVVPVKTVIKTAVVKTAVDEQSRTSIDENYVPVIRTPVIRYFDEQSFLFGKTRAQQLKCLESESRAYYDLIRPCDIQKKNTHLSWVRCRVTHTF